jgi:hypothetical protein
MALSTDEALRSAPAGEITGQSPEELAARNLGAVYEVLRQHYKRSLPLGRWALPDSGPKASGAGADLAAALSYVYAVDENGIRLQHPIRVARYHADHRRVMPRVRMAATAYARQELGQSAQILRAVLRDLRSHGAAAW